MNIVAYNKSRITLPPSHLRTISYLKRVSQIPLLDFISGELNFDLSTFKLNNLITEKLKFGKTKVEEELVVAMMKRI